MRVLINIDDEDDRTERPFFTGASQRACSRGATRGRCESDACVKRRQGLHEQDSTESADWSTKSAELVERCPLTTRRLVKENAAAAARVQKSQTCDMKQPRGAWLGQPRTSTAEQGHGARLQRWQDSQILTTCEEQAWKPSETRLTT